MANSIEETAKKIKTLQIKGARNIAIAAVLAFKNLAMQSKAPTNSLFMIELKEAQHVLSSTKNTEPLMRNAISCLINQAQSANSTNVATLKQTVTASVDKFLTHLDFLREAIAEIGSKLIEDNFVVLTHCYSSTVIHLLAKAKKQKKAFKVICTETRPEFQGRMTAKELVDLGIDTTFIVDSAVQTFIDDVDLVIVGADAITSRGDIINKIGTSVIAVLANNAHKPVYVVSELLKFDDKTTYEKAQEIEERDPLGVWADAPKNLIVCNPAFDITESQYIQGIICEEGLVTSQSIVKVIQKKYSWLLN